MERASEFLIKNINTLIQLTDYEKLLQVYIERKMFTSYLMDEIEESTNTAERHRLLLTKIIRIESLAEFLKMCEVNFKEAADLIKNETKGAKEFAAPSYRNIEENGAIDNDGSALKLYTEHVENEKNIVVQKATKYMLSYGEFPCYQMKSRKRGIFFFVNIFEFEDSSKFRKGANVDKSNLITLFREFGFDIIYEENISLKKFHQLIEELLKSTLLRSHESLVLCILSHGCFHDGHQKIEFTCGTSGVIVDIIGKFNNIHCPDLREKPKIFVLPMCRGTSEGVRTERYENRKLATCDRVKEAAEVVKFSDIKICYATAKGFEAYRDGKFGTWYIATFVDVLARHAHVLHFDDMLKIIGHKMKELCATRSYEEGEQFFQVVSSEDIGFDKYLFFNPGLSL